MKIAIVGAGISGVCSAQILNEAGHEVTVYEKRAKPGGLVRCDRIDGHLFHLTGGHVFNAKDKEVIDWFWKRFDREMEFIKAKRNAKILLHGKLIGYPIENYLYMLDKDLVKKVLSDLLRLNEKGHKDPFSFSDFASFLKGNFGETLFHLYFEPYNKKIWKFNLNEVPLEWLEGKLPMPHFIEILLSNINKEEESSMVHSTFYYPLKGGSQFIIDRLSEGLNIRCNVSIDAIAFEGNKWSINGANFDKVIYTGDVRKLSDILLVPDDRLKSALANVAGLPSNGTSNMLCETDHTDLSWLYLPEDHILAHRIIYTGNFSDSNNAPGNRKNCVIEFSGKVSEQEIIKELPKLPGNLKPIAYHYEPNSYIIQNRNTRSSIGEVKSMLMPLGFSLTGRFAEWEYYNMDKAIYAAMQNALHVQG